MRWSPIVFFAAITAWIFSPDMPWLSILSASVFYGGAHMARLLRLAILLRQDQQGLRLTARAHLEGSLAALCLPFKLGEIWRWVAVARVGPRYAKAFLALLTERLLDASVLLPLALFLGISGTPLAGSTLLPWILVGFVVVAVFVLVIVPQNIPFFQCALLARYSSPKSRALMASLQKLGRWLYHAQRMWKGQLATLLTLSLVSWILEGLAVMMLLRIHWTQALEVPLLVSNGALGWSLDPIERLSTALGHASALYVMMASITLFTGWIFVKMLRRYS